MVDEVPFQFIAPTTICTVGPSQSGKTMFTKKLIDNADVMFTVPPTRILYAYSEDQPLFDEMRKNPKVTFHEGLPDKKTIEEFTQDRKHTLIVIDDLMNKVAQSDDLLQLFTVTSHHRMASCCFLSQNLFFGGKYARSISLNCSNFVLFRNPRDMRQLSSFASQILPGKTKYFLESVRLATSDRPFNYLLVDLCNRRPGNKYMLRTGIFPGDVCVVYHPV